MSVPVLTQPRTPRTIARGVAFSLQLDATESPTSYAATGLPAGLSLNVSTGLVSGTPTAAGLSTASFTATNGSGTSAPVEVVFSVQPAPPGDANWDDVPLDFDAISRIVSIPGVALEQGEPLLHLKKGDKFPLLVGVSKWGVLREVDLEEEAVSLLLGIKEFEPERLVELSDGSVEKVGEDEGEVRYRIWVRLTPQQWQAILDDYEADDGTELRAWGELQLRVGDVPDLYDETQSESVSLQGGLGQGGYYDPGAVEETLVFTGLDEHAEATAYRITATLTVTGRPSQTVTLTRDIAIVYSGGVWVVTEFAAAQGSGAVDGANWRAVLSIAAAEGHGTGIDVDVTLTSTADATPLHIEAEIPYSTTMTPGPTPEEDIIEYRIASNFTLLDAGGNTIGQDQWHPDDYGGVGNFLDNFPAAWEAQTGAEDLIGWGVVSDDPNAQLLVVRFLLAPSSPVHGFRRHPEEAFVFPAATYPRSGGTVAGDEADATLTARLEQLEDASALPLSISSRNIPIGIARDIVPDA